MTSAVISGSSAFSWNKVDTATIKNSAMRAAIALTVSVITAMSAGLDSNTPQGAVILGLIASFGPTLLKAAQRYVGDNEHETHMEPPSF